jgi:hypothetical protein
MSDEARFSKLVEKASDPSRWVDFLELLAETLHSENTILWALHPKAPGTNIEAHVRVDPQCWQEYQQRFAAQNVWIERLDKLVPAGEIRYSEAAISESELRSTSFFNEFLSRWNWDHGFGVKIPYGACLPAHLTSVRSKRFGPFGENDGKLLSLLVPHVRQALLYMRSWRARNPAWK